MDQQEGSNTLLFSVRKRAQKSRREKFDAAVHSLKKGPGGKRLPINRRQWIAIAVLSGRKGPGGNPVSLRGLTPRDVYARFCSELNLEGRIAVSLLDIGKGPDGKILNLRALNEEGLKGLVELFEEIRLGEAKIRIFDSKTGFVTRWAFSLEIEIRVGDYIFVELVRKYDGKEPEEKKKNPTETKQEDEELKKTFFRLLLHELGIRKSKKEIDEIFKQMMAQVRVDPGWSKAYKGIQRKVEIWKYVLRLPERPKEIENGKEIRDTSVVIDANWVYSPEDKEDPVPEFESDIPFDRFVHKNLHKVFPVDSLEELPEELKKLVKLGSKI